MKIPEKGKMKIKQNIWFFLFLINLKDNFIEINSKHDWMIMAYELSEMNYRNMLKTGKEELEVLYYKAHILHSVIWR